MEQSNVVGGGLNLANVRFSVVCGLGQNPAGAERQGQIPHIAEANSGRCLCKISTSCRFRLKIVHSNALALYVSLLLDGHP